MTSTAPATPPLVLLRHDASSRDDTTHSSVFTNELTGQVLFIAETKSDGRKEGGETSLYQNGQLLGKVTLSSLTIGAAPPTASSRFYRPPHCFSTKRLFRLPGYNGWVCWQKRRDSSSTNLIDYKRKTCLVTVSAVAKGMPGATVPTRLTIPDCIVSSSPSLSRYPRILLPIHGFNASSSSFAVNPASSPSKGKAPVRPHFQPEKGKDLSFDEPTQPVEEAELSRPSQKREKEAVDQEKRAVEGEKKEAKVEPVVVVLLTLLHQDLLRFEKEKKEASAKMEDDGEELGAW